MTIVKPYSRAIMFVTGVLMIAAAWIWSISSQRPSVETKPPATLSRPLEILVANEDIEPGKPLSDEIARWMELSSDPTDPSAITRIAKSDMANPFIGRIVVEPIKSGQALVPRHFSSGQSANYLAGILSPGKRAFAIAIDTKGTASAGNFILPNDRVDIIRSANTTAGLQSDLLLSGIRVLAIGTNLRSEGVSLTGETATVEVDLREAEILATAQRSGQISLALRHPQDVDGSQAQLRNLTIIRPTSNFEKSP